MMDYSSFSETPKVSNTKFIMDESNNSQNDGVSTIASPYSATMDLYDTTQQVPEK